MNSESPAVATEVTVASPKMPAASARSIRPRLAVVVPCYNEQQVLPESMSRLLSLLNGMIEGGDIDPASVVMFVDDGSRDSTWQIIQEGHRKDPRVRGLKLSGNRGHQAALVAGLFSVEGDIVVSVDADLQDDLDAIKEMVSAYRSGFDVVYGVRSARTTDTFFKRFSAESYYRLLNGLGVRVVHNHADFRLLSRRALDALREYSEVNLFLRGIVPLIGFPSTNVYYERKERFAGETKYPLRKMLSLAADGITSFTAVPLRMIAVLGIIVSVVSVGMAGWVLWVRLFTNLSVPGWASSVIPIYFLGGIQLLSVGVLGEYVAKLYAETKRRPRYFIEERL